MSSKEEIVQGFQNLCQEQRYGIIDTGPDRIVPCSFRHFLIVFDLFEKLFKTIATKTGRAATRTGRTRARWRDSQKG